MNQAAEKIEVDNLAKPNMLAVLDRTHLSSDLHDFLMSVIVAAALGSDYKPPIGRDMVMALLSGKRELMAHDRNLNQIAHQHNTNSHSAAETDSLLDSIARSLIKAHDAVIRL